MCRCVRNPRDIAHDAVAPADWHLPDAITPLEADHGFPTRNLLGYAPSVRLRPDAAAFIANCDITGAQFPSSLDCVAYNRALMSAVSAELAATQTFKPKAPPGFSPTGSRAQLGVFTVPARTPQVNGNLLKDYNLVVRCSGALEDQLVGAASMFLYRSIKTEVGGVRCWSPYQFLDFTVVPDAWNATKNILRDEVHEPQDTDTHIFFDKFHYQPPFVIYADFESIITQTTQQTNAVSQHIAFCYIIIIGPEGKLSYSVS